MQAKNMIRIKSINTHFSQMRSFSKEVESKVIMKSHSPNLFEFILNVPKTLNAVDMDMCNMMNDKLKEWNKDPFNAPRVALMSGAGGKSFCAGGDIVSLYHRHKEGVKTEELLKFF